MTSTRHLIDPELLPGLDMLPTLDLTSDSLPLMREALAQRPTAIEPESRSAVSLEWATIQGSEGHEIGLCIIRPVDLKAGAAAVLHVHGGGYVVGSAAGSLPANTRLAAEAGCLIVSVDYRLAPETTFPGPVEDCYAALAWLHEHAAGLGVDSQRVAIMGESAGGGLAAALALLARDRGAWAVCHQHLIYPMLDDRTGPGNANPFSGEFIWTAQSNVFGWSAMLGQPAGSAGVSPYAAPARADHLAGLPSTYLSVGALDLFAEENLEYARRLMRAGVAVELHLYPGAYHGFGLAERADVTVQAREHSVRALRKALARR